MGDVTPYTRTVGLTCARVLEKGKLTLWYMQHTWQKKISSRLNHFTNTSWRVNIEQGQHTLLPLSFKYHIWGEHARYVLYQSGVVSKRRIVVATAVVVILMNRIGDYLIRQKVVLEHAFHTHNLLPRHGTFQKHLFTFNKPFAAFLTTKQNLVRVPRISGSCSAILQTLLTFFVLRKALDLRPVRAQWNNFSVHCNAPRSWNLEQKTGCTSTERLPQKNRLRSSAWSAPNTGWEGTMHVIYTIQSISHPRHCHTYMSEDKGLAHLYKIRDSSLATMRFSWTSHYFQS